MRYEKPKAGEWIQPRKRQYNMMCCDCGLVHRMQFRVLVVKGGKAVVWNSREAGARVVVQFQAERNNRATAATRRQYETIRVIKGKPR